MDAGNLQQAVARLRPDFLHERNPSPSSPRGYLADVYLDDRLLGGLETLVDIRIIEVRDVRLVRPVEATVRYGRWHPGGTLVVRTR